MDVLDFTPEEKRIMNLFLKPLLSKKPPEQPIDEWVIELFGTKEIKLFKARGNVRVPGALKKVPKVLDFNCDENLRKIRKNNLVCVRFNESTVDLEIIKDRDSLKTLEFQLSYDEYYDIAYNFRAA